MGERTGGRAFESGGMPGGLASGVAGICAMAVRFAWYDNSYASRFILNKAGVFPRFAAFWASLLRLAGSYASETRQIFPFLGKICLHARQKMPACIYNVNLAPMSFQCAFFPFPFVSLVLCRFSPLCAIAGSMLAWSLLCSLPGGNDPVRKSNIK